MTYSTEADVITAGDFIIEMIGLMSYAFYILVACAIAYGVMQYKLGRISLMIKSFVGAALFAMTPTLLDEVLGFLS